MSMKGGEKKVEGGDRGKEGFDTIPLHSSAVGGGGGGRFLYLLPALSTEGERKVGEKERKVGDFKVARGERFGCFGTSSSMAKRGGRKGKGGEKKEEEVAVNLLLLDQ